MLREFLIIVLLAVTSSRAAVNITIEPICRVDNDTIPGATNMLSPAIFIDAGYILLPTTSATGIIPLMPPPLVFLTIAGVPFVNFSTAHLGVIWTVSNYDTSVPNVNVEWSFADYVPPNISDITSYTVPFDPTLSGSRTRTTIAALNVQWFFSRSLSAQEMILATNLFCTNATDCLDKVPQWPPKSQYANVTQTAQLPSIAGLPSCACYVNVPCNKGAFFYTTNTSTNLTALPQPSPPPPPVPLVVYNSTCVPTAEICNGLDDNCNGIIDDVAGIGQACGSFTLGQCQQGTLQCVNNSLECTGQVLPQPERCTPGDYNCDGNQSNVPGLGLPCGNNTGACRQGTRACATNGSVICEGEVTPSPEICDGIDNDCNGLVDDGCQVVPGPPSASSPVQTPLPPPSPTPVSFPPFLNITLPNIPPLTSPGGVLLWLLSLIGVNPTFPTFNPLAWLILLTILLVLLVTCCIRAERDSSVIIERSYYQSPGTTSEEIAAAALPASSTRKRSYSDSSASLASYANENPTPASRSEKKRGKKSKRQ